MRLEKAYKKMLIENPFYGIFLLGMNKMTDESIPTACVRRKGINCEFAVNPKYWDTLDDKTQVNLLCHECYHIIFQHMFLWNSFPDKEVLKLAADCEVNSYLAGVPENWIKASMWSLPAKQGTKYYYSNIINSQDNKKEDSQQSGDKEKEDNNNKGNNNGSSNAPNPNITDSHEEWKDFQECPDAVKQLVKNQIEAQVKSAAEQTIKMKGNIPRELTVLINGLYKKKPRIFDWKSYFRRMLGSIYDINIKKTRRKESIRFPDSAGLKHRKKISILVAVDTSGSVSDDELKDFFSEITYIYKAGARITILECDATIAANYEYSGKWTGKIHGRGGTNFQPAIDYYRNNKKDYSAMVYFTDGECSLPINVPRDTLWVITSNGSRQNYPGKVLYIPTKEK